MRIHGLVGVLLAVVAFEALAVYNQEVVLTGGPELASAQISFASADGQTVNVTTKDEDDRRIAYIAFDGDSGSAGTLNVTANGKTQSHKIPAAAAGQVIRVNTSTGVVTVDPAPTPRSAVTPAGPAVSAFYGVGNMEIGSIGSGAVTSSAAGEKPLTESDDNVDVDTYGLDASIQIGDSGMRAHILWASYSGDDDTRAQSAPVAGGGIDNAIVFQQESPTYGTGFNGGLTPAESFGTLKLDGDKYGASLSWPCASMDHVLGTLGLYYQSTDLDQKQFDSFTTVAVNTQRRASVSQDSWLMSFGGTYLYPFNDHVGASISAGALVQLYDANLQSRQEINFFTSPQEILERSDDDDAVAFGGYLAVGLPITFGMFTLTPSFVIETGTASAEVKYPNSGDAVLAGEEVSLDNESTTNWAATVIATLHL